MEETIYSVSAAVKLLAVQSHVLRYWEEEMKLPIKRNEMGHRYYTGWDIQVFLSIKELKRKGYSLKEIGQLTALFYNGQVTTDRPKEKKKREKRTEQRAAAARKKERTDIPSEFMDIISRIVTERLQEKNSEEARYKRLDQRIRNCQQSRREVAAAAEKKNSKKKSIFRKSRKI